MLPVFLLVMVRTSFCVDASIGFCRTLRVSHGAVGAMSPRMRSTCEIGGGRAGLDHRVAHMGHSGEGHPPHEAPCLSLYLAFSRPWISRHAACPSILTRFWPPGLWHTAQRPGPHSSPVPAVRLDKAKAMPGCPERGQRHVTTRQVYSTKHCCWFRACTTSCIFAALHTRKCRGGKTSVSTVHAVAPPTAGGP